MSWNVLVPKEGAYNLSTDAGGGGTEVFDVDGRPVGSEASANSQTAAPIGVTLSPGLHTVRVVCTSGAFDFGNLYVRSEFASGGGPDLVHDVFLSSAIPETRRVIRPPATTRRYGRLSHTRQRLESRIAGTGGENSFGSDAVGERRTAPRWPTRSLFTSTTSSPWRPRAEAPFP